MALPQMPGAPMQAQTPQRPSPSVGQTPPPTPEAPQDAMAQVVKMLQAAMQLADKSGIDFKKAITELLASQQG